ncbi:hypothetical protein NMY22_g18077 [Coprinellus aureogranulatus]|nr:hypothetical protein NMY22_g18077 [Coprinellus aureogranulatus]
MPLALELTERLLVRASAFQNGKSRPSVPPFASDHFVTRGDTKHLSQYASFTHATKAPTGTPRKPSHLAAMGFRSDIAIDGQGDEVYKANAVCLRLAGAHCVSRTHIFVLNTTDASVPRSAPSTTKVGTIGYVRSRFELTIDCDRLCKAFTTTLIALGSASTFHCAKPTHPEGQIPSGYAPALPNEDYALSPVAPTRIPNPPSTCALADPITNRTQHSSPYPDPQIPSTYLESGTTTLPTFYSWVQTGEIATMKLDFQVPLREQLKRACAIQAPPRTRRSMCGTVRMTLTHTDVNTFPNAAFVQLPTEEGAAKTRRSSWSTQLYVERATPPTRCEVGQHASLSIPTPKRPLELRRLNARQTADTQSEKEECIVEDLRALKNATAMTTIDFCGDSSWTLYAMPTSSRSSRSKREARVTASANAASSSIAAPGHENGARLFIDHIAVPPNPWKSARTQSTTAAVQVNRTGKATTITLEPLPPDPTPTTGSKRKRDSLGSEEDPLRKRKGWLIASGIAIRINAIPLP